MNASASWRDTEDAFDASQFTTQTQILLSMNWSLGRRTSSTIGARYQWIRSSVTNDATEAAIFASLNYSFN
jgi:hypothetical protein